MRLIFIIAFLCMNLITSLKEIELGKRIQFNGENKQFTYYIAEYQHNVFLLIIEYENGKISYSANCGGSSYSRSISGTGKEIEEIFTISKSCECTFNITGNGNFVFYSFKNSVAIDLKDTYGNINLKATEIGPLDSVQNEPDCELTF